MNDQTLELIAWLTLTHAPDVGIKRIQKLLRYFSDIESISKASTKQLEMQQLTPAQIQHIKNPNQQWIATALEWMQHPHHHIIPFGDVRYPALLAEIAQPPAILYVNGEWEILSQPQIALVGSRNPSHTGLELSTEFAYALTKAGLIVTSGLALGVDAASHHGALNANGKTIAVLGSGLQQIYPARNKHLAEKIIDHGCLVSEFPLTATPIPENFPRRNRIISGLSLGTLVIEAAPKSGSLITAHFALEQGREVFAIPGSIRNPMAKGCLSLIQQGAKCVMGIEDILEELKLPLPGVGLSQQSSSQTNSVQLSLDSSNNPVLACIDNEVTTIDQICIRSKLSPQFVTSALLQLELDGIVNRYLGGYVKTGLQNE